MEASTLPLPWSRSLVTPKKGLSTHLAATQGICLDHLTLVANRSYILTSNRTVTNGEGVLKWLPPGHSGETAN